jgi:hypothetical protein
MTGFFSSVKGFNLTNDSLVARRTISGSKSGRERASLWGNSEPGSVGAEFVVGITGCCSKVVGMILAPESIEQHGKELAVLHKVVFNDGTECERGEEC